jgi:hypothetical protein
MNRSDRRRHEKNFQKACAKMVTPVAYAVHFQQRSDHWQPSTVKPIQHVPDDFSVYSIVLNDCFHCFLKDLSGLEASVPIVLLVLPGQSLAFTGCLATSLGPVHGHPAK